MAENTEQSKLSPKLQRFIDAYLETWNATEAARIAQYTWPEKQGSRLLKRPYVKDAIRKRLDEAAMPANEVLTRITQHSRVSMGDFLLYKEISLLDKDGNEIIDQETGKPKTKLVEDGINWEMVRSHGHLIKEISWNKAGKPVIKLVDNQTALQLMGKHHHLFNDRTELTGADGGPIENVVVYIPDNGRDKNGA